MMDATLKRVKIRLGISTTSTDRDELLLLHIEDAETYFKDYCKRNDIPAAASGIIEQLVVTLNNSHGGVQSERVGDTSTSYFESIVSSELKTQMNRYRGIITF